MGKIPPPTPEVRRGGCYVLSKVPNLLISSVKNRDYLYGTEKHLGEKGGNA